MSEKPSTVAVGQMWRETILGPSYTVTSQRGATFRITFESRGDEDGVDWMPREILKDIFVGWADGRASSAARDWSRWLPPAPLTDTGDKTFKQGQVWATALDNGNKAVFRIGDGLDPWAQNICEYLAAGGYFKDRVGAGTIAKSSPFAEHAVMVQDVGQLAPTPPEVLYGRPGDIKVTITAGGPKRAETPKPSLPAPVPVDPYADNAFVFEKGEKMRLPHHGGTPLTCLQRIPERKPPAPWQPSVDDFDLLPDAGS